MTYVSVFRKLFVAFWLIGLTSVHCAILLHAHAASALDRSVCMSALLSDSTDTVVPVGRNSKFLEFYQSPAINRWKRSREAGYQRISNGIASYTGHEVSVEEFNWGQISFHGAVQVTRKNVLVVTVDAFVTNASSNRSIEDGAPFTPMEELMD